LSILPNVRFQKNVGSKVHFMRSVCLLWIWMQKRTLCSFYLYEFLETIRFENMTFWKLYILKLDVFKPNILKPNVSKSDVCRFTNTICVRHIGLWTICVAKHKQLTLACCLHSSYLLNTKKRHCM
jgi:hypothetical protein